MYELKVIGRFAAAHNLTNYEGKCEALHGHNWTVEAFVVSDRLDEAGMALDFGILKKHLNAALDELDHKYLNELPFFAGVSPSSERIAKFVFERLLRTVGDGPARVTKVSAWESENSCASYIP